MRKIPHPLMGIFARFFCGILLDKTHNVIRNTSLLDILSPILSACEKQNIPLIVLKGLSSIASIYQDPGLRVMADLDLLCRPSDLPGLRAVVISSGFGKRPYLQAHHLTFYHEELGFPLEFHFSLQFVVKHRKALFSKLWDRSRQSSIDDLRLPILSPEDTLLFDLAHILDHVYVVPLKNYLDLMAGLLFFESELDLDYLEAAFRRSQLSDDFGVLGVSLSELFRIPLRSFQIPIRLDHPQSSLSQVESSIRT
ncbi:MAG: nucleotidyltransferase family protein, partial [Candidatus Aminicenantes bacterium]|nr:nucleotidyltransferase family protein [Candidatus Aminicenantes bacterium]